MIMLLSHVIVTAVERSPRQQPFSRYFLSNLLACALAEYLKAKLSGKIPMVMSKPKGRHEMGGDPGGYGNFFLTVYNT